MLGWLMRIFHSSADDVAIVRVYLNPLINTLIGAEKQKGAPLTEADVLEILKRTPYTEMTSIEAKKLYKALDQQMQIPRLNPNNIWNDWQKHRPIQ
jgi:hypothetical protein